MITALAVGAVLPFGMLLSSGSATAADGLRIASALVLFGTALHFVWLLVPAFDDQALVVAAACTGIAVLLLVSFLTGPAVAQLLGPAMPNEEMGDRTIPQPPDVATGVVLMAVAGFLAFIALTMTVLFFYLRTGAPGAFRQATERHFPEPALQKKPQADLKRFELEQRMSLSGYGWIDRSRGIARIPIEEAMRIIAARGDHAYDPPEPPPTASNAANQVGVRP